MMTPIFLKAYPRRLSSVARGTSLRKNLTAVSSCHHFFLIDGLVVPALLGLPSSSPVSASTILHATIDIAR